MQCSGLSFSISSTMRTGLPHRCCRCWPIDWMHGSPTSSLSCRLAGCGDASAATIRPNCWQKPLRNRLACPVGRRCASARLRPSSLHRRMPPHGRKTRNGRCCRGKTPRCAASRLYWWMRHHHHGRNGCGSGQSAARNGRNEGICAGCGAHVW